MVMEALLRFSGSLILPEKCTIFAWRARAHTHCILHAHKAPLNLLNSAARDSGGDHNRPIMLIKKQRAMSRAVALFVLSELALSREKTIHSNDVTQPQAFDSFLFVFKYRGDCDFVFADNAAD